MVSVRRAVLAAASLAAATAACRRTAERTVYLPTPAANLVLVPSYPIGTSCSAAQSWLVHVDTAGGKTERSTL